MNGEALAVIMLFVGIFLGGFWMYIMTPRKSKADRIEALERKMELIELKLSGLERKSRP